VGKKKLQAKLGGPVISGEMTLEEARARYNLEAARHGKPPLRPTGAAVAKSAGAAVPQVWENHSNPQMRGAWDAMVLKSASGTAPTQVSPASLWTDLDLGLLREYEEHPDPVRREGARKALVDRGMLPGVPAPPGDRQIPITLSPEVRGHLYLPGGWKV
jgi:hypothetical protein